MKLRDEISNKACSFISSPPSFRIVFVRSSVLLIMDPSCAEREGLTNFFFGSFGLKGLLIFFFAFVFGLSPDVSGNFLLVIFRSGNIFTGCGDGSTDEHFFCDREGEVTFDGTSSKSRFPFFAAEFVRLRPPPWPTDTVLLYMQTRFWTVVVGGESSP